MSNSDFTYGNILLLYCVLKEKHDAIATNNSSAKTSISQQNYINESSKNDASYLPDYIVGRINLCIETFNIIMGSKPDKFHTSIVIVSDNEHIKQIRSLLITGGISEKYLEYDDNSKSINSAFKNIMDRIVKLANPPSIYFIGSVWQKDIVASIISSKLKDYKVFFEGALDNRPYDVVQKEKLKEKPEKGSSYYKRKMTNKAIDLLLNYIFPKNKDKANVSE